MIDLSFIKPETIPTIFISALTLVVAGISAVFAYKNYKLNEGAEWRLKKISDSLWQLERNHKKRVALVGFAAIPSHYGVKVTIVSAYQKFLSKGDTIQLKVTPRSGSDLEGVKLLVYFKPYIFKSLNKNSYNEDLVKEIINRYGPKWHLYEEVLELIHSKDPAPSLAEKAAKMANKILFKQKLNVLRIRDWSSDLF